MHIHQLILFFSSLFAFCCCLWPSPEKYEYGSSVCWLSRDLRLDLQPAQSTFWDKLPHAFQPVSQKVGFRQTEGGNLIQSAFSRFQEVVRDHAFVPWKFYPKGADFEPELSSQSAFVSSIMVKQHHKLLASGSGEAYDLRVSEHCEVLIRANEPLGVIHGFTSLTQLFYRHSSHENGFPVAYMRNAPVKISDAPVFEHRGLNLDISRNVISPRDVTKTLDALALSKFNRLHLHASDAQSWPLEVPSLPELAAKGAYHKFQIWTATDLDEVQRFGAERGIEVYIEIDMPGHTASIHPGYPELITSFNRKPWEKYSAQPPSGQLDLNSTAVHAFLETLLSDLLPRTKPYTSLFHLGGDEIRAAAYNLTPAELQPYLQTFTDRAISLVTKHGLTPLVWEEQLLDYNLTLPITATDNSIIVQAWRGASLQSGPRSSLAEIIGRGHRALFGSNDYWYLDCGRGTYIDPPPLPPSRHEEAGSSSNSSSSSSNGPTDPYLDYCAPYKNYRHILSYEPLSDIPASQRHLVLGGEVHLWGELTDGGNLDEMLWPRVAAAGEVLWRGSGRVGEETTRRLAEMREWVLGMGVRSGPVQVTWCLMNRGVCVG